MNDIDKQNLAIFTEMLSKMDKLLENYNKLSNIELELEMVDITDTCVSVMEQYDHPKAHKIANDIKKNMDKLRIELDKRETK